MKILKYHLKKFIKQDVSDSDLSELFLQLGHENEFNDEIFDFDITPNRGDCLSTLGLARELNNHLKVDLSIEKYDKEINSFDLSFVNKSPDSCPRISFLKVEIEDICNNYQPYLEKYFKELNLKKNNFFTDISNYLSYEIGQPTHCYDFSKISGQVSLEEISSQEKFKTILGSEISLSGKNLVFICNNSIINLAGLMGGTETGCSSDTKIALIECAYFEPESVIGKSVKYNLKSDAAHKFERGTDPNIHNFALRRFLKIVEDHSKIKSVKLFSNNLEEIQPAKIKNDLNKVESILGINLDHKKYKKTLENLGFSFGDFIVVPSFRSDINNLNDISEEVARIIGYDSIKRKDFKTDLPSSTNKNYEIENLKSLLIDNGFYESISFPFCEKYDENSIKIDNPLDSNKGFMRRDLKDSLLEKLIYNEKRQKDSIKFFEISSIYSSENGQTKVDEVLGIIASGRVGRNYKNFSKIINLDFFKTIIEEILIVNADNIEQIPRNLINSKSKHPIFYFEIPTRKLNKKLSISDYKSKVRFHDTKYHEISEYPSTFRDISFEINNEDSINNVMNFLDKFSHQLLKEKFIFDYYVNNKINKVKLGVRLIFQSNEKTLTDSEVDIVFDNIVKSTKKISGVEIPGL